MIKRFTFLITLGVLLSGCYMVPLALVGPATSGFTTASLVQTGITTSASFVVKKSTGKSISEHAFDALSKDVLRQTYFPQKKVFALIVAP